MIKRTLYHFHFCCGLGGGAAGFNRARPRVGNVEAEWVCLGGIDVDPAGLRDFERLAGVPGTLLDLFTRDQYVRFHGKEPPTGWREATPRMCAAPPRASARTRCSSPAPAGLRPAVREVEPHPKIPGTQRIDSALHLAHGRSLGR